jgi:hypothetical protein
MKNPQLLARVRQYLSLVGKPVKLKRYLGAGTDGAVWESDRGTAIKVFETPIGYANERDTYLRLAEFGVTNSLNEFWIPQMRGYDDDLQIVEMDLMQDAPFIIDFAKVRIDRPPEFSDDVLEYHDKRGREQFGEDNWRAVQRLMSALESFQIYYLDPRPHNIVFPDQKAPKAP